MLTTGTLTKARIVEAVVEITGYTKQKAHETIIILLELIKRSLESGEDRLISGFGKFCVILVKPCLKQPTSLRKAKMIFKHRVLPYPKSAPEYRKYWGLKRR